MKGEKGKLIVIDGTDGCGKSTQSERLLKILSKEHRVKGISFPCYDMPSAALVKMYLNGEFSDNAADVNAYAASTFYAADRYASYRLCWEENYLSGEIILASRYVSSNIIHQCPKLPEKEWDGFVSWLTDFEYNKLGLPRPDLTVLLDLPPEISDRRLSERYSGDESKKDIHEKDGEYLKLCRKSALYAAEKCGWKTVSCISPKGVPFSPEDITGELMKIINEVI